MRVFVPASRWALLGLIGLAACRPTPGGAPVAPGPSNVLLITLDTFRADRVGPRLTPVLDRLASQGLRFVEARSVAPLTLPAHVSILTGLLPPAHGIRVNGAARLDDTATLATELKAAGYQTRAVVGAFVLDRRFGLDAGFDEYDDRIARDPRATDVLQAERPGREVVDRAIRSLDGLRSDAPWLLWVHLYDAHAPYAPPPDALARAGGVPYDGEVAAVDDEVGRLLTKVDARADATRTAVVVVGDHGESLGEHGEPTHGMLVFEPALRVPLIVRAPGVVPAVRTDAASLVDIGPTVLALAGLRSPQDPTTSTPQDLKTSPGRNLLLPAAANIETYAESEYPSVAAWAPTRALAREGWKLVVADRPRLFDLTKDPGERADVASAHASLTQSMTARLDAIRRGGTDRAGSAPVSAETAARLRSLGYVAPAPGAAQAIAEGGTDPATVMEAWAAFESALADTAAGHAERAVPVLARLVAAHPASPIFESTYARTLVAVGRGRQALPRFRAAVTRWPGDWALYHELAVLARDQGLPDEAMRAEEAALALQPREPSALNGKGLLLADAGRHDEAARAFEDATRFDPTNAVYAANLGNARRALGDLDGAATAYRRALDRAPDLADAANGLGVVLVQQQRPAEAIPWLERAARDASFIEAQLNLGIACERAGDPARAIAQYRKVLSARGPYTRERDAARALLARLESR